MTYLEALRRKLGVETIDEVLGKILTENDGGKICIRNWDLGVDSCPKDIPLNGRVCLKCWAQEAPEPVIFEEVETIYPCTVQILRNPKTGEESVGWFRGEMEDGE